MSLLLKSVQRGQVLQVCRVVNNLQTKQCHWLPALKPGPYPKTEEERIAAAKKYNLLPEEYEPYPDDGRGAGDYPKLPYEAVDEKDQYHNWDYKVLSRDFMEPVPREIMQLLPYNDTPSQNEEYKRGALIFFSLCSCLLLCIFALRQIQFIKPLSEKQLVGQGKIHYSFEIDEDYDDMGDEERECVPP